MASYKHQYEVEQFRLRLAKISDVDIAWFAGWLCADGCIHHGKRNGRGGWSPNVRFNICDRDPLERFVQLFGGAISRPRERGANTWGKKPLYMWGLVGMKAVVLLERCMPWLSLRYRERAIRTLEFKHILHNGRKIDPAVVEAIKLALTHAKYGTGVALARQYGVSTATISHIKAGRQWQDSARLLKDMQR